MDKALLEYRIKKKHFSKGQFCEAIGMDRTTFYRKCNGISEFSQSEIGKIIEVLEIEDPVPIFFSREVS
jgi:hypothetical protein